MEVAGESQIVIPSISDTLDPSKTSNSSKRASKRTDFPLKSMQNCASDEEIGEIRDLTISEKHTQSLIDSYTIPATINSAPRKSIPGTKNDKADRVDNSPTPPIEQWHEISFNKKGKDVSIKPLLVLQDSLPDPVHFIETGFQVKKDNSLQRRGEDGKDTAFQMIQKIHI